MADGLVRVEVDCGDEDTRARGGGCVVMMMVEESPAYKAICKLIPAAAVNLLVISRHKPSTPPPHTLLPEPKTV